MNYAITILLLSLLISSCEKAKLKQPSNIIFILADDLGYNELSCYGQKNFSTPNIDKLAADGMRFTDFYAGNTVCGPSRCSLITGKHPGNASIRANWGWPNGIDHTPQRIGINKNDQTLGEILKKAGYKTAHCGKWHIETAEDTLQNWPIHRGYDYVIREKFTADVKSDRAHRLEEEGIRYDDNYPYAMWKNGERISIPENDQGQRGYLMDDIVLDGGMEFIRENHQKPFFVFFSLKIPHSPETLHTYEELYQDKGWPECERVHAARIVYHDNQVAKITGLIDSLGLGENTVIFYSSDNGGHSEGGSKHPSIDPCKHDHKFFKSNAPFRGYKRDLYEGGIRVPFIARWPGHITPGTTSNHIGAFWDVMATLADISGAEISNDIDGISFLPELLGKKQTAHSYLYWEFYQKINELPFTKQAVRKDSWKGVRYGTDQPIEVYNLKNDIGESNDLSAQHPEIVGLMDSLFEASHTFNKNYPKSTSDMKLQ